MSRTSYVDLRQKKKKNRKNLSPCRKMDIFINVIKIFLSVECSNELKLL